MRKTYCLIVVLLILVTVFSETGVAQSPSDNALIARQVFSIPPTYRLTSSFTNTQWGISLYHYPVADALGYIMEPSYLLHSGMQFHLDKSWNRVIYAEFTDNTWIREYGTFGTSDSEFMWPRSIDTESPCNDTEYDPFYHVYISDYTNSRIVKWRYDWNNQLMIGDPPLVGNGLQWPVDLDLNNGYTFLPGPGDYLWIINGPSRILRMSTEGDYLSSYNQPGCSGAPGEFCNLTAIACGRSDQLSSPFDPHANNTHFYIADAGNNRISWWIRDNASENIASYAEATTSSSIVDMEVDGFGQVWAVDQDAGMLIKYTYDLFPLCTFGSTGIGVNQFMKPNSLSITGGYLNGGNMMVGEDWTDSSGQQYFAIGTDIVDFAVRDTANNSLHYIEYVLIDPSDISVKIYDLSGQLVRTLFDGGQYSGARFSLWDGLDNNSQPAPPGQYEVVIVDSCIYGSITTGEPTNVVTKQATFYHNMTCCQYRGNVDGIISPAGPIDVADLSYLIAFLFSAGPPPPCDEEGNVDNTIGPGGPIDVSDVTYLIAFLFKGGPVPPACD